MFGRRSTADQADTQLSVEPADSEGFAGKGRATPKRKEAQAARKKMMAPPKTRKEASTRHRERVREQRLKQRQALAGDGEDRFLPARDQGPVKKYVRDFVDSRRTIGEFLIPIFIAVLVAGILVGSAAGNSSYASSLPWLVVVSALVVDSLRIVRGVKAGVTERFGAGEANGIAFYALMRSWQMRRLRLPKAKVRPGAEI